MIGVYWLFVEFDSIFKLGSFCFVKLETLPCAILQLGIPGIFGIKELPAPGLLPVYVPLAQPHKLPELVDFE
jgi:hypothetical protein